MEARVKSNFYKKNRKKIVFAITISTIVGGYLILCAAMNTTTPLFVVSSGSMEPTMYEGDLVFVQHVSADAINPGNHELRTGDVILYDLRGLWQGVNFESVAHRVIEKTFVDGKYYFKTQGDANPAPDPSLVPEDKAYGKIVAIVPKIGWITLFVERTGIAIPLVIVLAIILVISFAWDATHPDKKKKAQDGVVSSNIGAGIPTC